MKCLKQVLTNSSTGAKSNIYSLSLDEVQNEYGNRFTKMLNTLGNGKTSDIDYGNPYNDDDVLSIGINVDWPEWKSKGKPLDMLWITVSKSLPQ